MKFGRSCLSKQICQSPVCSRIKAQSFKQTIPNHKGFFLLPDLKLFHSDWALNRYLFVTRAISIQISNHSKIKIISYEQMFNLDNYHFSLIEQWFFYRLVKFLTNLELALIQCYSYFQIYLAKLAKQNTMCYDKYFFEKSYNWTHRVNQPQYKKKPHAYSHRANKNRTCDNLCSQGCPFPPIINNRFKGAVSSRLLRLITGRPYDKCRLINPFFLCPHFSPYLTAWQGNNFYGTTVVFALERVCVCTSMMEVI